MLSLSGVPSHIALPSVLKWAREARRRALALEATPRVIRSLSAISCGTLTGGALGILSTPEGRAFVNATWAADWAAYETEDDRVDYVRLAFVMNIFPDGFTLYVVPDEDGTVIPVGYAAFYPISRQNHEQLTVHPEEVMHRGQVVPLPEPTTSRYVYVFNYSMVKPLRRTDCTRTMLRTLQANLQRCPKAGLCAITVSDDGSRVAARLGMRPHVQVVVGASREMVFTTG